MERLGKDAGVPSDGSGCSQLAIRLKKGNQSGARSVETASFLKVRVGSTAKQAHTASAVSHFEESTVFVALKRTKAFIGNMNLLHDQCV